MRRPLITLSLLPAMVAAALAGCAPPGPYPSLAPRPIEAALASADVEPPAPPLPDDAGLPGRIAPLAAAARRGQTDFATALAAAQDAVGKAGAAESDSWIMAQQALSRAEAARAVTVKALTDLDMLAREEATSRVLSPADQAQLDTAIAEARVLADRQMAELARLQGVLGKV